MATRKLPPVRDGRKVLSDKEDVRPSIPGYIVTRTGEVYSDTDPPLLMAARNRVGNKAERSRVKLSSGGKVRDYYIAALVLTAWHGDRPEGAVAQHYDGDPLNCHADNLYWGYPQSRLDPVEFVRAWQSSHSFHEVAERMGATYATVLSRGRKMLDRGVPLKKLSRGKLSDQDYEDLAKLADELK